MSIIRGSLYFKLNFLRYFLQKQIMKNFHQNLNESSFDNRKDPRFIKNTIYVTHLPNDIMDQDLRFLFCLCGKIKSIKIVSKKIDHHFKYSNDVFAYAYVEFYFSEAKQKANKFFNDKSIGKKTLIVKDYLPSQSIKNRQKYQSRYQGDTFYQEQEPINEKNIGSKRRHLNEDSKINFQQVNKQQHSLRKESINSETNKQDFNKMRKNASEGKFSSYSGNSGRNHDDHKWREKSGKYERGDDKVSNSKEGWSRVERSGENQVKFQVTDY